MALLLECLRDIRILSGDADMLPPLADGEFSWGPPAPQVPRRAAGEGTGFVPFPAASLHAPAGERR